MLDGGEREIDEREEGPRVFSCKRGGSRARFFVERVTCVHSVIFNSGTFLPHFCPSYRGGWEPNIHSPRKKLFIFF